MTKIVMTIQARDEEDIIEANIRFHLERGVDHIIVTDNASVDRTPEILAKLQRETGKVDIIYEPRKTHDQGVWVTRMARRAYHEYQADWVIHNDADEFWWPYKTDIKTLLSKVPEDVNVVSVQRKNFLPAAEGPGPFYKRMLLRERKSLNANGKPLPPKIMHRGDDKYHVSNGNHTVFLNETPVKFDRMHPKHMVIWHYPMRSLAQFEAKIVMGATALAANQTIDPKTGQTWQKLYQVYKAEGTLASYYNQQLPVTKGDNNIVRDVCMRDALSRMTLRYS